MRAGTLADAVKEERMHKMTEMQVRLALLPPFLMITILKAMLKSERPKMVSLEDWPSLLD